MKNKLIAEPEKLSIFRKIQETRLLFLLKTIGRIPQAIPNIMNDFSPIVWTDRVFDLAFSIIGKQAPKMKNALIIQDIFGRIPNPSDSVSIMVLFLYHRNGGSVGVLFSNINNPSEDFLLKLTSYTHRYFVHKMCNHSPHRKQLLGLLLENQ